MENLGKLIGAIGAAAMGGVVLAKSLKSPKKRLEEVDLKLQALETQFEETQKDYERDKNDLLQRIAMRDRKAEKRLKALNREFEDKKQEYKEEYLSPSISTSNFCKRLLYFSQCFCFSRSKSTSSFTYFKKSLSLISSSL